MKPRKLPSGNWNVQLLDYIDDKGKRHIKSFTADTKSEVQHKAMLWLANEKGKAKPKADTLGNVIDRYIELSEVLSPATLSGYRKARKNAFQSIMDVPISDLTDTVLQSAVNAEAKRIRATGKQISAKTVKNEWGLLTAAVKAVKPDFSPKVKLPRYQKHIKDYPEPAEVLKVITGTDIELPCLLAMWLSFTMSECRGLKYKDVKDGYITINRVRIFLDTKDVVKDTAKTETRLRRHKLPDYITRLIGNGEPDEYIIKGTANGIYKKLRRLCVNANIVPVSFHDLRHYSASIALMLGVPDKYIMERGGWKTPNVMKGVYQNTYSSEREVADAKINEWFTKNLN